MNDRKDQEQYPPDESRGTQPHLPKPGRPKDPVVGNQMGGNQEKAAEEQHESSDKGDRRDTNTEEAR